MSPAIGPPSVGAPSVGPPSIGIDFGTSNSAVALAAGGRVVLEAERTEMPSAIFVHEGSHEIVFGRAAITAYIEGEPGRFMRGLKSLLGSPLLHERTAVSGRFYRFDEIIGLYLSELKARAERQAGEAIASVVVGRPVAFVDGDREADRRAQADMEAIVRACGFERVAFQYEPVAAAFAHERTLDADEIALVADIGGGTADFCLVRLGPDRTGERARDIVATAGVHIGGTDYDREISLHHAMPALGRGTMLKGDAFSGRSLPLPNAPFVDLATWHRIPFLYDRRVRAEHARLLDRAQRPDLFSRFDDIVAEHRGHELALAVEGAKIAVSETDAAVLDVCGHERIALATQAVAGCTAELTARIEACVEAMLRSSGIERAAVSRLIWMGGGSLFPPLRDAVGRVLPDAAPISRDLLGAVSVGLAVEAGRRFD